MYVCVYEGAVALTRGNGYSFGASSGRIWLNNVLCIGTESVLLNCPYSTAIQNCAHTDAAGVRCASRSKLLFVIAFAVFFPLTQA